MAETIVAHQDPAKAEQVRELLSRFPLDASEQHPIEEVLRTGRATLTAEMPDSDLRMRTRSPEHLAFLRELGLTSHMAVPLTLHGRTLGAMLFVSAQVSRRYNQADLRLAEALADRAAYAIENARLYRHTQKLNERLELRVLERTAELEQVNRNLAAEILERTQAEEHIRRSEHQLAQAQQVAHVGSWQWDIRANTISWSDELYRIYGLQPQTVAMNYEGFLARVHPADRERVSQAIGTAYSEHEPFSFDHRIARPDGEVRTLHARGDVICDEQANPIRMVGTGQDISERKLMEDELRRSREDLRSLAGHLQTAREEERTRVAREIHDELGQVLTAVKMDLTLLGHKFADKQKDLPRPVVLHEIKAMSQLIDDTIQSVREIITELRPEMLEDLGLRASIEWQVQEFETRTGIRCQFTSAVTEIDLDLERATAVFRILQEALTNVARHAHATQVQVLLKEEPDQLILEVQDNGKGILESEMTKAKSFGILGMRERALLFGGNVDIRGSTGRGTTLTVKIPQPDALASTTASA